nr:uncharacterized protein LOC113708473 [Coffea arabica]
MDYMRAPPFTDDINEERLLSNFKLPVIPSYDGRCDPEYHIHVFISAFRLYCISDPIICRTFSVFLQGTTRKYFWGLEPRSISILGELVDKFLHRFISSRPTIKTSAYLLNIQQNSGESLRTYVQRFQDKNVQILDPKEQVTIAAFTNRLTAGVFNTGAHKKFPRTLREFWQKVKKSIQPEDLNCMKREAQVTPSRTDSRRKKESSRGEASTAGRFQSPNRDRRSVFDRTAKRKLSVPDSELIPLKTNRSYILSVMEQNPLRRSPPRMVGKKEKRNFNLCCAYHRDIGNETEDCNNLKKDIEDLIKRGYLKQFVRSDGECQRSDTCQDCQGESCRENNRGESR